MSAGTILLVEDNPVNAKLFTLMLESAHYTVLSADSAEIAMPLAEEKLPHLILMDIGLPGIDGLEASRRLKKNPITQRIPIIAVTAHSLESDRQDAIKAGCEDFISKPVRMKDFLDCVERHLPRELKPTH